MKNTLQQIAIKSIAILLLLAVVFPSVVKFTHAFKDHKHEVCTNTSDTHFHNVEIDCEFYKFKLNTVFSFKITPSILIIPEENHKTITLEYHFKNGFQSLPFSLRGPPQLV